MITSIQINNNRLKMPEPLPIYRLNIVIGPGRGIMPFMDALLRHVGCRFDDTPLNIHIEQMVGAHQHVSEMQVLAEYYKSLPDQVIISTHSPDLLDHFSDSPEAVIVLNPDGDVYTPSRLNPAHVASWIAEGWGLGDLYRVGDSSIGGWPV